jgi:3-hydroxybutyryl-CoA dehydrogenase
MTTDSIKTVGVIGSGAMGRGIVQLLAQAEYQVKVFDTNPAALAAAMAYLDKTFATLAEKGKLTHEQATLAKSKCKAASIIADLADCQLVVEAIVERLDIKQQLFKELEAVVAENAIIASNTSSLSITALAASAKYPARIAGLHFFNPVPLMRVVEVVRGARTSEATIQALVSLVAKTGHRAVVCIDAPGFIVNHAGRGYGTESLKALGEGVADIATIDATLREHVVFGNAGGFKLGPFELLDLTGLDVSHPVMESIYHQFYDESRFRPSYIGAQRQAAGLLGRKTSEGFYRYAEGKKIDQSAPSSAQGPTSSDVPICWIAPGESNAAIAQLLSQLGARVETGDEPTPESIVVLAPLGLDASSALTELAQALDLSVAALNPARVVALDTFMPFGYQACKRRVVMGTPATNAVILEHMTHLLGSDGAHVSVLNDSAGFISQRVVALVVAIACEIAQQQIASPTDIDDAVRLGLGYPVGPLTMGDMLGPQRIAQILLGIYQVTNDPRYRPSLWLQRRAQLGLNLL